MSSKKLPTEERHCDDRMEFQESRDKKVK